MEIDLGYDCDYVSPSYTPSGDSSSTKKDKKKSKPKKRTQSELTSSDMPPAPVYIPDFSGF